MPGNFDNRAVWFAPASGAVMREHLLCVIPMEPGNGARALLISIGRTIVGEEREVAVGAWIDSQLRYSLRLMSAFDRSSQRNDRPGTDEQGNGVDGSRDGDHLATLNALVGPEVIPIGSGRQIDLAAGRALVGDRRNQKGRSEHILVAQVGNLGIIRKVQRQGAHERSA